MASRRRSSIPARAGRLPSLRSWKPKALCGMVSSLHTTSTSMKSLGGPHPVPTSWTRKKVTFPEDSSSAMSPPLREIHHAENSSVAEPGLDVVDSDAAVPVERVAQEVEHPVPCGFLRVG